MMKPHSAIVKRDWGALYRDGRDFVVLSELVVNQIVTAVKDGSAGDALDVGCGVGNLARQLQQRSLRVTGVDPSSVAIARAGEYGSDIMYLTGTIADVAGVFDLITCKHVIVFVGDQRRFIQHVAERLANYGVFAIVTPTLDRIVDGKAGIAVDRQMLVDNLVPYFEITQQAELPSGLLIICRKNN